MYKNLVLLDTNRHKNLKINPYINMDFAKHTTLIPVLANEIALLGSAFPVVFSATPSASLVLIVSLDKESLAITPQGQWATQYVPAFFRRYPFSLGQTQEKPDEKLIMIDENSEMFSTTSGERLFDEEGKNTTTLQTAINFLMTYEEYIKQTLQMTKTILESDILEDMEISVGEGEDKRVLVTGFKVVSKDKLKELDDLTLAQWVRSGIMALIDSHLNSLEHIQTLFTLTQLRQGQGS